MALTGAYTAASSLATVPRIASGIVSLAYLAEVACQMVFWGFAYASLGKSRACQNVCCTALVVVTLVSLSSIGAPSKGRASKLHGLRSSALYREIAREFKLSDRELQIMALLAEGYSRTYIRDSLGVSEGTIKAHASHIYQKIGIHRKDDLLDLVESRRS